MKYNKIIFITVASIFLFGFCYKAYNFSIENVTIIPEFAKSDTVYYDFVIKNKVYFNKQNYLGEDYEFKNLRVYENDSVFQEMDFINKDSSFFKYRMSYNDKWFIFKQDWEPFFINGVKVNTTMKIMDFDCSIVFRADTILGDSNIYLLDFLPPKNVSIGHTSTYFFHKKMGLIGEILYNGIILYRKDYLETQINSKK